MADVSTWGPILPFLGAVLGSIIGTPIIEAFKDRLVANRQWKTQRKDLIEKVRFVTANIDAFWELKGQCVGDAARFFPEKAPIYLQAMRSFELNPALEVTRQLAVLAPGKSENSNIAQYLVHLLLILLTLMKNLQAAKGPELPSELMQEIDQKFEEFKLFLGSQYGKAVGIDGLGLLINQEIVGFRRVVSEMRSAEAGARLRRALKDYDALRAAQKQSAGNLP